TPPPTSFSPFPYTTLFRSLAVHACRRALAGAGLQPDRVDRLIVGTVSPDHSSPSAACIAQKALGLIDAPAFDLTASCSGFLYARSEEHTSELQSRFDLVCR